MKLQLSFAVVGTLLLLMIDGDTPLLSAGPDGSAPSAQEVSSVTSGVAKSVFSSTEFPKGLFEEEAIIRDALGKNHDNVEITFYNAQFQKVTSADTPGRYAAVVQIKGEGSRQVSTLYRLPDKLPTRPELGITPTSIEKATPAATSRLAILLAALDQIPPGTPLESALNQAWAIDADWWGKLREKLGSIPKYDYLVDLPKDYDANSTKRWLLILFLHGSGERGSVIGKVRAQGLAKLTELGDNFPAIVVSPQCPEDEWWQSTLLLKLLTEVSAKYHVDPDRICVTGLSMGGFGTWALALARPDLIASAVPMCGASDPSDAARIKNLPVWAFHGEIDAVVPVLTTTSMIAAIQQAGGNPHLTLYPGVGHYCWQQGYATSALYTWLLAQKRGQVEVITPGLPTP